MHLKVSLLRCLVVALITRILDALMKPVVVHFHVSHIRSFVVTVVTQNYGVRTCSRRGPFPWSDSRIALAVTVEDLCVSFD